MKRIIELKPGTIVKVHFKGHFMHGKTTTIDHASSEMRGLYWINAGKNLTVLHDSHFKAVTPNKMSRLKEFFQRPRFNY